MAKPIIDKDIDSIVNTMEERYKERTKGKDEEIARLQRDFNELSTTSFAGGVPNNAYNRGDQSDAFAFPMKWALTCKQMSNSQWLNPVLKSYKSVYEGFDFEILGNEDVLKLINDMHSNNFAAYTSKLFISTLKYGFYFWTPTYKTVLASDYGIESPSKTIKVPHRVVGKDPTGIQAFIFDKTDSTKLSALRYLSQPKEVNQNMDDYYSELYDKSRTETVGIKYVDLPVNELNLGHATCEYEDGNPLGTPVFFSAYGAYMTLQSLDNSFYKNLKNVGEHSFTAKPFNSGGEITDKQYKESLRNIKQTFITSPGGILVDKIYYIEKIDSFDGDKWSKFKESAIAELWKSLGIDDKALGMTKGATRDLSEAMQIQTIAYVKMYANEFIEFYEDWLNRLIKQYYKDETITIRIKGVNEEVKEEVMEDKGSEFSDTIEVIEDVYTPEPIDMNPILIEASILEDYRESYIDCTAQLVMNPRTKLRPLTEPRFVECLTGIINGVSNNIIRDISVECIEATRLTAKPYKGTSSKFTEKYHKSFVSNKLFREFVLSSLNKIRANITFNAVDIERGLISSSDSMRMLNVDIAKGLANEHAGTYVTYLSEQIYEMLIATIKTHIYTHICKDNSELYIVDGNNNRYKLSGDTFIDNTGRISSLDKMFKLCGGYATDYIER